MAIKDMERELTTTKMEKFTEGCTTWVKEKAMDLSTTLTGTDMKEIGEMA